MKLEVSSIDNREALLSNEVRLPEGQDLGL